MSVSMLFSIGAVVLIPILCAIAIIDLRSMIIPDPLNLFLAMGGLAYQILIGNAVVLQLASAATVFCIFWLLRAGHARVSGRVGIGLGDVKFIAAAALWVSPLQLPLLLFIASATALTFVVTRVAIAGQVTIRSRVPFGPFLSLGLACVWTYEQSNLPGVVM